MNYSQTPLSGAYIVDLEKRGDDRGFFARFFCAEEFAGRGLEGSFVQGNLSWSRAKGTLRGMHYQIPPAAEVKLVRCVRGAIWDVILDLRPGSPSFGRSFGVELTSENRRSIYVPRGFAHGFLTLTPDAEVLYMVSAEYSPGNERGIRWNDPNFGIEWPYEPAMVSPRDSSHPDFEMTAHLADFEETPIRSE